MHLLSENPESFINSLSFIQPEELVLSVHVAGEGNMNAVFRVKTNRRSVIAKQSFPFVRKYPQIPAPTERIDTEYQFLKLVEIIPEIKSYSPRVIEYYPDHNLLILEDFGSGSDFTGYYRKDNLLENEHLDKLISYLSHLHSIDAPYFPDNHNMRELNHEHIFRFPFDSNNGLDLDSVCPGLQAISTQYKENRELKLRIEQLGVRYLSKGNTLLHGDYYPGSWISTHSGIKVIDPEFGFVGDREFDLGVFIAHLIFSGKNKIMAMDKLTSYAHSYDEELIERYAGTEILRRLIGIAQLPLKLDLNERKDLLNLAASMILK